MKKSLALFLAMLLLLTACEKDGAVASDKGNIVLDPAESRCSDSWIDGDLVYIEWVLTLENTAENDVQVLITAVFQRDADSGLLAGPELKGYSGGGQTNVVIVRPGTAQYVICFIGGYGGTRQAADQGLPPITIIELA